METTQMILIIGTLIGVLCCGALVYVLYGSVGSSQSGDVRELMATSGVAGREHQGRMSRSPQRNDGIDPFAVTADDIRRKRSSTRGKVKTDEISSKLFRAGFFTSADKQWFIRFRIIAFSISLVIFPSVMLAVSGKASLVLLAVVLGAIIGFSLPMSWLERQIRKREEDVLYYLPLVIEQVSIGVSSALDIGPCISNIVTMASERDSHNPVTEMFVHSEKLLRSGLNLEDALVEVSEANGMSEVKHAFMFLAQCSKHGGEISKQLQELADAVMTQRQVQIEGKITALPVKATGPLAMVFAGFFALLFAGLLTRLLSAFGG